MIVACSLQWRVSHSLFVCFMLQTVILQGLYPLFYTMKWMLRKHWMVWPSSIRQYRHTVDVTANLFSLFCPTSREVFKKFARLFWILKVNASKKTLAKAEKPRQKARVLGDMKMPKQKEIFTTVSIVCHHYERLTVLQMWVWSFTFEQVKALKNLWEWIV